MIVLDIKGFGAVLPDMSVKDMIIDYMLVAYIVYVVSAYLLLNPIWNFYVEKRDEGLTYKQNANVKK